MNVNTIINEEFDNFLNELVPSGLETFPFEKSNSIGTQYHIRVNIPEKGINAIMVVNFGKFGETSDKAYSISFKEADGAYGDRTGFGVQFRLLATISKIVKEFTSIIDPNILSFTPVQKQATGNKKTSPHQRFRLYMEYVKAGAGEDFDAFVIGDSYAVNVEKRNPSFPLESGYIDPEDIQDIITKLSVYKGYYETVDIPVRDPEYRKFVMSEYNGATMITPQGSTTTISMRKFVDWILNSDYVEYVHGDKDPYRPEVTQNQAQPQGRTDAPVQRVVRHSVSGDNVSDNESGDFLQFLERNVYGNQTYDVLDPYIETLKSLRDFEELKNRARQSLTAARTTADRERLLSIIDAVDTIINAFEVYSRGNGGVNEILNEILTEVSNLIK